VNGARDDHVTGVVLFARSCYPDRVIGRFLDAVLWFGVLATALAVSSLVLEVWDTITALAQAP